MNINIKKTGIASDKYLVQNNVLNRMIDEYLKYGYTILAYDFDDTVFDTHNESNTYAQVIEVLQMCSKFKEDIYMICFTVRDASDIEVAKYLDENNIRHDAINDNCPHITISTSRKILYSLFLDDKAGLLSAYETLVRFIIWLLNHKKYITDDDVKQLYCGEDVNLDGGIFTAIE
jgi:hypothetical protein